MNSEEPLLRIAERPEVRRIVPKKCQIALLALTILIGCGTVAFGLTALICNGFKEKCAASVPPSTTTELVSVRRDCGKRIVGYGWEAQEITESRLSKLTHFIFCCAELNTTDVAYFPIVTYRRAFLDVRNLARDNGVKVMVSIGGSTHAPHFSQFAMEDKREFFVKSTIAFIKEYNIDGIDIYWLNPNEDGTDRDNYVHLVRDLRIQLTSLQESQNRTFPYILTVLTPSYGLALEEGTDLRGLAEYVDFFNIATDDYTDAHSYSLGYFTKPHAPLFSGSGAKPKHNVDWTMRYYTCETRAPEKLNMGLPFYGRYWKNVLDPIAKNDEMWRKVGDANGTVEKGLLLWKSLQRDRWNISNIKWDDKTKSSYIWDHEGKRFLGIDDERSLREKMEYVKRMNLGGVYIWAVEMDDYSETLLNAVTSIDLCGGVVKKKDEIQYKCN